MTTDESSTGKYHIGMVSRLTGISTHALRVWERRYGIIEPERTPGGNRVYSDDDVDALRLIKGLVDRGHSIGRLADLDGAQLAEMDRAEGDDVIDASRLSGAIRTRFLDALADLDLSEAERVLTRAASVLDPTDVVFLVVEPIVAEIGLRWQRGDLRIAHEHAASGLLRSLVGTMLRIHPPGDDAPVAVATTPSGELHEFGILMASLLTVVHGWRVVYLGPNLPAEEVVFVARETGARLVLVSVVTYGDAARGDELERLAGSVPDGSALVVGGRAAPRFANRLIGATLAGGLADVGPILAAAST